MVVKTGTDIVHIEKFRQSFRKYPNKFKKDIFFNSELQNSEIQHLAGLFAAKEAVIKALDLGPGSWKKIEIMSEKSGKPFVKLLGEAGERKIESCDLSWSHHGDYVVAVAVFLLK